MGLHAKFSLSLFGLAVRKVHLLCINVCSLCRIPLPELKDSDKLDKVMNMKEAARRVRLGPECLPSICFYTFLNAYQVGKRVWVIGERESKL